MKWIATLAAAICLAACSGSVKLKPAELVPLTNTAAVTQTWQTSAGGRIDFPLQMTVVGKNVATASSRGIVALIDTTNGKDVWRLKLDAELSSGVGFDGSTAAVTTKNNELVAIKSNTGTASLAWSRSIQARTYTAPLVAGGRIFVLTGERVVHAFDADNGVKLWSFQRQSEPLILSQSGTLGVYRNSLIVGHGGRMLALNPDNGQVQWETSVATTRATNDIERLIDLVGIPNRAGDSICVRSYQAAVACVDAVKGATQWTKLTVGSTAVSGNTEMLVSAEMDGRIKAWTRATGEQLWVNEQLLYRGLSAPFVIGNSVVVGDAKGFVHVMNRADGIFTARFATDGNAIIAPPVAAGNVLVVATAYGGVFAFSP